ncbi:MAG TPA: ACP S-malonyltransferase, partial [Planctomycetota bacterium]|nr:ACP S-malonyltransferase [Planctomycetota bacterium]
MSDAAFLFSGQGAQKVGMAKDLCDACPASRKLFDRASEILTFDLAKLCFEGPQERLNRTDVSQSALLVGALAALEAFRARQTLDAAVCGGLSLGEYTALVHAGVIDFETGVRLLKSRGEWMQADCDRTPSGMASVLGLDADRIREACEEAKAAGVVGISNLNSPGQVVISGDNPGLARASDLCKAKGAKRVIPLKVAGAYHSTIMSRAADRMAELLDRTPFRNARIPVASNVDGKLRTDGSEIKSVLKRQITG